MGHIKNVLGWVIKAFEWLFADMRCSWKFPHDLSQKYFANKIFPFYKTSEVLHDTMRRPDQYYFWCTASSGCIFTGRWSHLTGFYVDIQGNVLWFVEMGPSLYDAVIHGEIWIPRCKLMLSNQHRIAYAIR